MKNENSGFSKFFVKERFKQFVNSILFLNVQLISLTIFSYLKQNYSKFQQKVENCEQNNGREANVHKFLNLRKGNLGKSEYQNNFLILYFTLDKLSSDVT